MKKRNFAVKPLEPLILQFPDGTEKQVVFNIEALMILMEQFGDIDKLIEEEFTKPIELTTKMLYAGMKVLDTTTTYEEARNIVLGGGIQLQVELIDMLNETFGEISQEELKKTITPKINQMLKTQNIKI